MKLKELIKKWWFWVIVIIVVFVILYRLYVAIEEIRWYWPYD